MKKVTKNQIKHSTDIDEKIKKRTPLIHNKVLFSLLISYILVLLFPIIFNIYSYNQAYQITKDKVTDSNIAMLQQLKTDLDNEFQLLDNFITKLSLSRDILNFLNINEEEEFYSTYDSILDFRKINNIIQIYEPYQSIICEYYIYSSKSDLIWHNSNIYKSASYMSAAKLYQTNNSNIIHETYLNMENQLTSKQMVSIPQVQSPAFTSTAIFYPMPITSTKPKGYIALLLSDNKLQEYMKRLSYINNSILYILDNNNIVLFSSSETNSELFDFSNISLSEDEMMKINIDNTHYLLYSHDSDNGVLHYVSAIPQSYITSQISYMLKNTLIILIITLIFGVILIVVFTKKNYSPFARMAQIVRNNIENPKYTTNDYAMIIDVLSDSSHKEKAFEETIMQQKNKLCSLYLSQLLKDDISQWKIPEPVLIELETNYISNNFAIILTLTDITSESSDKYQEIVGNGFYNFFDTNIIGCLNKHLDGDYQIFHTEVDELSACIINIPDDKLDMWQNELRISTSYVVKQLREHFELDLIFAISCLHHSIADCPEAFQESLSILSHIMLAENNKVLFQDDITYVKKESYAYTMENEQKFINYIRTAKKSEVLVMAMELWDQITLVQMPFQILDYYICDFTCSLIKAVNRVSLSSKLEPLDITTLITPISNNKSIALKKEAFFEALDNICNWIEKNHNTNPTNAYLTQIDQVLNNYLYNENLSISFLSNQIGINAKYLSTIYKGAHGVSLMDTIHKKRISKFKQLVSEKELSVLEAAKAVGYNNVTTFNRWFKKFEGITPGQLKKIN